MSMHDVEDFAEQMVCLVDESNISNKEKIDLIHNIYQFHDSWDTGFTKLRVYNILIKTGYFRLFDPHEHPDYEKYKDFFDDLPNSNEMYIYEDPIAGYSEDAKLTSYWFDYAYDSETDKEFPLNKMCCEAGSPVWAYFEGADKAPKNMSLFSLFYRLTEFAAENEDVYAMGELYLIMIYGFNELDGSNEEDIKCIEKMKPILLRDGVMVALKELYLDRYIGSREEFKGMNESESVMQLMYEWFDYYFEWKKELTASGDSDRIAGKEEPRAPSEFYALLLNGEIDPYFEAVKNYNMKEIKIELKGLQSGFRFTYPNITLEGHEKIISYDVSQTEDENIKLFVAGYKEWYENKTNVNYYIDKARESLNVNQDVTTAFYYIHTGLKLDPSNATLKLYKIHSFLNYLNIRENNALLKHLEVLNEIFEKGLDIPELKAFAYYLKAVVLYRLDEKDASKAEMKKAVEFNPDYVLTYERYFGKEK